MKQATHFFLLLSTVLIKSIFADSMFNNTSILEERNLVVSDLIYSSNFNNPEEFSKNWIVQQATRGTQEPSWEIQEDGLHVRATGGTTIWNTKELTDPILIEYTVSIDKQSMDAELLRKWQKDPSSLVNETNIVPSDINCFWMAHYPGSSKSVLDSSLFAGKFKDYHKMNGYYASLGGRAGLTTRARRYPRTDTYNEPLDHPIWIDKDGEQSRAFLNNDTIQVTCFAINGHVLYAVNGYVLYEYKYGDTIQTDAKKQETYNPKNHPPYTRGYFGFRLVRSNHIYKNIRISKLKPLQQ